MYRNKYWPDYKDVFVFFHCKITVSEICLECRLCILSMIIDAITANPRGFNRIKLAVNSCNLLILRTKSVIFNLGLWTNKACRSNIPRHFSSFDVPGFAWPQGVTSQKKKTTEKNNNDKKNKNSSVPGEPSPASEKYKKTCTNYIKLCGFA